MCLNTMSDRLDDGISATCGSILQLKHTDVYNNAISLVKAEKFHSAIQALWQGVPFNQISYSMQNRNHQKTYFIYFCRTISLISYRNGNFDVVKIPLFLLQFTNQHFLFYSNIMNHIPVIGTWFISETPDILRLTESLALGT